MDGLIDRQTIGKTCFLHMWVDIMIEPFSSPSHKLEQNVVWIPSKLIDYLNPCLHVFQRSLHWYEGESISNQPIPFPMDLDGHYFHALFQYMFYMWIQNCPLIGSFFNKTLNVKTGLVKQKACFSSKVEYRAVIRYLYS